MSPTVRDHAVSAWQLWTGARVRGEECLAAERDRDLAPYLTGAEPVRVLDLANGRLRPQYLLLRATGHRVVGVDQANRPGGSWRDHGFRLARWLYARHLPRSRRRLDGTLVGGDVGALPFRSESFDLVTSIAAFEHFLDVPAVVSELQRVMRPGAVAYIRIHVFTAPSGGHNVSATQVPLQRLPRGVDAWDHLRRRRLPLTVALNEWRIGQYVEAFALRFEIVRHYCAMREGEALLTPVIAAELAQRGYPRDELTCGAYVILARKTG